MKKLLILLMIVFVAIIAIDHVNASNSAYTITTGGYGDSIMTHTNYRTEASGNDLGFITGGENFNANYAGEQILTLGASSISSTTIVNNRLKNTYDSKTSLNFTEQAAYGNTYTIIDNRANIPELECDTGTVPSDYIVSSDGTLVSTGQKPSHQEVSVEASGLGASGGRYKAKGVIDDANLTSSIKSEGALGGVTVDYSIIREAGFSEDSDEQNFASSEYGHQSRYGINDTGYYLPFDIEYSDASEPFETITNVSRLSTVANVTNTT